jgi:hypothetical protein
MRKVLAIFTVVLLVAVGFATSVQAEGEIELYPYDKIECLEALDTCTTNKVGDAHWDLAYNGYNYNFVNGSTRFVSEFDDANLDGFIDPTEMPAIDWNAFAALNINNTASEVIMKTANGRADLTTVAHFIYAYFDETGKLQMFEDNWVTTYHIKNDGTAEAPDWRLATQAEADAYDAADPKPDDMSVERIRIALDDTDPDGYVLEPTATLYNWAADGVDTATAPVTEWSDIIADDPNNVVIPAGWTVMSFGTLDRDGTNAETVNFIKSLVDAMVAETETATVAYDDQPAMFANLTGHDDDAVTPGINMVVDYGFDFSLPDDVTASWINMFDDTTGEIINEPEMLDYSVTISQDGVDLETINYTYDGTEYTASAAQTVVDGNTFGAGYTATYSVTTPEGDVTEVMADIVVGVMPPRFADVEDRYINEGMMVDLLGDITADDGYGNDKTDDIMITYPDGFNPYYPLPGEYQIDLEFTHTVVFEAPASEVTIDGVTTEWDPAYFNTVTSLSDASQYAIFTDSTMAQDVTWGYGRVLVLVGADGLVDAVYDRYTWDVDDETGSWNDGGASFETWKASIAIEKGGFVIGAYGSTLTAALRALTYDDPVSYNHVGLDTITFDGVKLEWDRDLFNSVTDKGEATTQFAVFTNSTMAQDVTWGWGTIMVLVGADGLVDAVYNRYNWDITDVNGFQQETDGATFPTWKDNLTIEDGGFAILGHGSNLRPFLEPLAYDTPVSYAFGENDFEIDIVTEASYMLTVDDMTPPVGLVVDDNYTIFENEFGTANEAILANVVAFDNYSDRDDLAIYVSNNGGLLVDTVGTYTVEVTIEDYAGHTSMVSFDVEVVAAPYTDAEIDAALAALETLTETEIQALVDALEFYTPAEVDAAIAALDFYTEAEVDAALAALETLTEDEINALIDGQDLLTEAEVQEMIDAQDLLTDEEVQTMIDDGIADALADAGCGGSLTVGSTVLMSVIVALGSAVFFVLRKRP